METTPVARLIMAISRLGLGCQIVEWSTTDAAPDDQYISVQLRAHNLPHLERLTGVKKPVADLPGQLRMF